MSTTHQTQYSLRNDKSDTFQISAGVSKSYSSGEQGAEITADVCHPTHGEFKYVVEFGGEFTKTKMNFTPEMYLHTAISIVQSQIESKKYVDTRLRVHRDSGLTETSPL